MAGGQNPLANVLRFGFTPLGSGGSTPPPTGTDYRHERRIIIGLSQPYIRFGYFPVGSSGSSPSPPTGTDYRHERPRIVYGLNHQYVRFGFQPIGTSGTTPVPPTPEEGGGYKRPPEHRHVATHRWVPMLLALRRKIEHEAKEIQEREQHLAEIAKIEAAKQSAATELRLGELALRLNQNDPLFIELFGPVIDLAQQDRLQRTAAQRLRDEEDALMLLLLS